MQALATVPEKVIEDLLKTHDIHDVEDALLEQEQAPVPLEESIVNGMYVRKIIIPAGTVLVSKVWLEPYLDIMVSGDITVYTEHGTKRLKGLNVLPGRKLRKRVGLSHEDTVWITVHRTEELSTEHLEFSMTADSVEEGQAILKIEAEDSYLDLLAELNMTEEEVQTDMNVPVLSTGASIQDSLVHGSGTFAVRDYEVGESIGHVLINGTKTDLGRYTNHASSPNTRSVLEMTGNILMVASQYIFKGEELTMNYKHNLIIIGAVE